MFEEEIWNIKKVKKNMDILPAKVRFTAKACRDSSKCFLGSAESK